jgi:hypothetical protein
MAKKQPDTNIPQHEIEALVVAYFQKSKNSLKARKDKKNLRNGKHRGQKKQKRKGAYDKSGGITHNTAAFAFRTKDILKIRNHPRLEPGSDYHYLVREMGLEPTRPYSH